MPRNLFFLGAKFMRGFKTDRRDPLRQFMAGRGVGIARQLYQICHQFLGHCQVNLVCGPYQQVNFVSTAHKFRGSGYFEADVMPQRGYLGAGLRHLGWVDLSQNQAHLLTCIRQHLTPGTDDQAVAVCAGAKTKQPVSMALARNRICQWASPVVLVKAAGTLRKSAPAFASAR
jgi:hypothetical protein